MAPGFEETLATHKVSLANKNSLQNQHMNTGKGITETSREAYGELYDYIAKIADVGKKVFKGKATEDEYNISLIVKRMRSKGGKKD